jgi:hypothetical protein
MPERENITGLRRNIPRRTFCRIAAASGLGAAPGPVRALLHTPAAKPQFVLDMVHIGPGEATPRTAFLNPRTLSAYGYNGQVVLSLVEGVAMFDALSPAPIARDAPIRAWAAEVGAHIDEQIKQAHAAGLQCFAWMQLVVFPIAVVQAYKAEICDAQGRIDLALPRARQLLEVQLAEVFSRFPKLDGLVIRTGEIYLQGLPFHASTSASKQTKTQGSSAILHEEESHKVLLQLLRDQVCVRLDRFIFYRTWDFGERFHVNPVYYLRVTEALEPHPKLIFSVKHQKGDFHQLTPFNPTLMIGKHRQIVEVQCQREAYGKGAHPYYIGRGVIDGWEEMAWLMKSGEPRGLRDIVRHPLYAGTWTWSRGGGWEGPYLENEMWCALNAYVIAKFSENPSRSEADIFAAYARSIGLRGSDLARFYEMQLLSAKAVLRGQLTSLPHVAIDVWWTRDDKFGNPNLSDFEKKHLVQAALDEKLEAKAMWARMAELARQIAWKDAAMSEFVQTSIAYGQYKYEVIRAGWTILFRGREGDASGTYDTATMRQALLDYDAAWSGWRKLKDTQPSCATLYKDVGFADKPGLGAAVDRYRTVAAS